MSLELDDMDNDPSIRAAIKRRTKNRVGKIKTEKLMTFRDVIAHNIMLKLMDRFGDTELIDSPPYITQVSFAFADEMIKARNT